MAKKDKRIRYQSDAEKPVMLSLRVPRELYDRLERYAGQHRQSITDLVKDGIEMRLEVEADPRSRKAGSTTDEMLEQIDGASILREMRDIQSTLARHDTQMQALRQAIERQTTPTGNGLHEGLSYAVIHGNTALEPDRPEAQSNVLQAAQNPAQASVEAPPFDTTRYRLGKLCPKGHAFGGTGQSLLRQHNQRCRECENEGRREGRAKKRQGQAPEQRPGGALPDTVPPYDPTTRRLGKLCPRGHDYHGTGQSLRTTHKSGYCLACNAERVRERRQATAL